MSTILKRTLDIMLALIGVLLSLPLFPFIAILIKFDSKGPVFYLCDRIGKNYRPFRMYKFRTMIETPVQVGGSVSPQGDVRVTSFGRFLRRTKLNELPQLINILKGEMSWVGPRPEAPDLAELYPPEARGLFSVRPGLVGPAQFFYRNEEELYPEGVEPKDYYIQHILPEKLRVDFEYVGHPTLLKDLKYIFLAFKETMFGAISQRHFFENISQIYLFFLDMVAIFASYFIAMELRFEGMIPVQDWKILIKVFAILLFFRIACFVVFGLYGVLIRYLNLYNYITVVKAVTLSTILTALSVYLLGYSSFPRSILVIDWLCMNTFMILVRVPSKVIRDMLYQKESNGKKRVLIFGACDKGSLAATQLRDRVNIIGFLDDDSSKRNKKIQQYRVMGGRYDIEPLSKIYPIDEIVIAISNLDDRNLNHIISLCHKASVKYSIFTTLVDSYSDRMRGEYIRNRKILQWIGGQELKVDLEQLESTFSNKGLLLIGSSVTMGLELLKYLSPLNTGEIILLDRYESYLNETLQRSREFIPKQKIRPLLSSEPLPMSAEKILSIARSPNIIIHMGTRKYPYSIKADPLHIVRENILNTWDLPELARKAGCELFVMTSSIGAANPISFIPATLRLAEHYLQSAPRSSTITSSIVRLYNLVENRGSILWVIQNQLRDGKKIVLNHPEEERYFFDASSAAKFILLSVSMALDSGGETQGIYMPALNGKVRVLDLAKLIIQDFGLDPDKDIEIEYVGSEDLAEWKEEIDLDGQLVQQTPHENIMRIVPHPFFPRSQVLEDIEMFRELVAREDRGGLVRKVEERIREIQDA